MKATLLTLALLVTTVGVGPPSREHAPSRWDDVEVPRHSPFLPAMLLHRLQEYERTCEVYAERSDALAHETQALVYVTEYLNRTYGKGSAREVPPEVAQLIEDAIRRGRDLFRDVDRLLMDMVVFESDFAEFIAEIREYPRLCTRAWRAWMDLQLMVYGCDGICEELLRCIRVLRSIPLPAPTGGGR